MAQLTIYLPSLVAKEAKRQAKRARKSLSAYVTEIVARETDHEGWPRSFVDLLQSKGADLREPPDPPPGETDILK